MTASRAKLLILSLALLICLALTLPLSAQEPARVLVVGPGAAYQTIEAALSDAQTGNTIEVHGGTYQAPLYIDKTVTLIGFDNPIIDGQGSGSLLIITAPEVHFEGFTLRNSGNNLGREDTGIVIQAARVTVTHNVLENVLFGLYFANANEGLAQNNRVNCIERDMGVRGDGIRVWFSEDVRLIGNEVSNCRDTLIWYAQNVSIEHNTIRDSRYGLHAMYSSNAVVSYNTFEGNSVGSYLMYSQHVTMTGNQIVWNRGPSGYGIAFKEMDYATISDNVIAGNRSGLYIDNSPALYDINNTITGNFIAYNDSGISALPSTTRNIFHDNIFLDNLQQVSVLGRGDLLRNTWQLDGTGNYWSDYVGYDGNGDGIGDTPYRAENLFERLTDEYPSLKLFAFSPATQAIDFAASAFPSLRPAPRVIDDAPLTQYQLPIFLAPPQPQHVLPFLGVSLVLLLIGVGISLLAVGQAALPPKRLQKSPERFETGQ